MTARSGTPVEARPDPGPGPEAEAPGLRIGDVAARAGVSTRTLRYYEELGLLRPSGYTPGGERRYQTEDIEALERILELRDVLGMNLDDIRAFLGSEDRLDELRTAYRARKGQGTRAAREQQRVILTEALAVYRTLTEQLEAKLARMEAFATELAGRAERCAELLDELGGPRGGPAA